MESRREHVVKALRRRHIAKALRAKHVSKAAGRDTKARAAMDRMLAEMERKKMDVRQYLPKTKPAKPTLRIVVADLKKGCEQCLDKPAVIQSIEFKKLLCLECEDKLMIEAGAVAFEKVAKPKLFGNIKKRSVSR